MIHAHETIGMLKLIDNTQVCTIHKIVTFHGLPLDDKNLSPSPKEKLDSLEKGKGGSDPSIKSKFSPKSVKNVFDQITKKANTKPKLVKKEFYHIPIRNDQTGKIEVNTLLKEESSPVTDINETGPQEDFMSYKKPELSDAPIDRKTTLDLEKLLEQCSDAFTKDTTQIGTTPLIEMDIDIGDNPPIVKRPYTIALKHYDFVKEEINKLLNAGVIRESNSNWSAPIVVVPKQDGGKRLCGLQVLKQDHKNFYLTNAQGTRHIYKTR